MDNKDEFNVMSKISMAKVMREHSYTEGKIDYIIQCAKNALKKHKDIPAEVDNGVWYNVDYAVEKTIVEGINFIKNMLADSILPGDVFLRSKELHLSVDVDRAVFALQRGSRRSWKRAFRNEPSPSTSLCTKGRGHERA